MTNTGPLAPNAQHTPDCPELPDDDGGTRPCTWFDHDAKLAQENDA